jgi:predicted  nucleic acid-binding Zn-ribbon protein
MYLKQIEQLVVLQKVDDEILLLKQEIENAPKELAELEARYQELLDRKAVIDDKIETLKKQRDLINGEIEQDNLKIKKSKSKLMMVGNTREYHAMMREMDNMEKVNRMREEEKISLAEELTRQQEMKDELQEQIDELGKEVEEVRSSLDKRLDQANKRLKKIQKDREKAVKTVPAPVLGRYEFIRQRMANPVIVPVEGGVCKGCNIAIPPQSFIELQKGQQILSCPNCQRLIYWCEHFEGPEQGSSSEDKTKETSEA